MTGPAKATPRGTNPQRRRKLRRRIAGSRQSPSSRRTASRRQLAYYRRAAEALAKWKRGRQLAEDLREHGAKGARKAVELHKSNPCRILASALRRCNAGKSPACRCRTGICPRCRPEQIRSRASDALKEFSSHPQGHIFLATVLVSAERQLFDAVVTTNILDPLARRWPTSAEMTVKARAQIKQTRQKLDSAFKSIKATTVIAEGAFEYAVVDVRTCGPNKARFLNDLGYATGQFAQGTDVAVLHLHFVIVAKAGANYISADTLSEAFRRRVPHRHQVQLTPLWMTPAPQAEIVRVISYAWKSFTNFRPGRIAEISLTLSRLGFRTLAFSRRRHSARSQPLDPGIGPLKLPAAAAPTQAAPRVHNASALARLRDLMAQADEARARKAQALRTDGLRDANANQHPIAINAQRRPANEE